ncbi:TetR/AcrR family transcriptional regulator [Mycolicibacterium mageritense]|uniref:TetR/AcrR family transcriptional regulator n=1 Tax=Mycolicibacterium mageritense TaxID=53462 RepID=UPI001E38F808|nr:TetR/AcrR family transcriptional regulator [Mycolicibacterium mageritense]
MAAAAEFQRTRQSGYAAARHKNFQQRSMDHEGVVATGERPPAAAVLIKAIFCRFCERICIRVAPQRSTWQQSSTRQKVRVVMRKGTTDAPPARRPGGRSARVKAQILAATAELVARDGIAGFRYEDVAAAAGVHKASVYRNWPDREELVAEALLRYAEGLASIADTGDIRRDLVDFLVALAAGLETPFGRTLERAIQPTRNDATLRALTRVLDARVAAMRQRVDTAVDRGELPPVDSSFLGEMISGPVHLIVNRGMRTFTPADAERIVDVVLAGIRSQRSEHQQ